MENKKPTQCERIRKYLKDFGSITQLQALSDLGIMRLASRISEMRQAGEAIEDRIIEVKNRYGETCRIKEYYVEKPNDLHDVIAYSEEYVKRGVFNCIAKNSNIDPQFVSLFRK